MKRRISAQFFVIGVSVLATPALHASNLDPDAITDSTAHPCNGCSAAQIVGKATALGRGNHYVYDLVGGSIHRVEVECAPAPGGSVCYGDDESPPVDIATLFGQLKTAYDTNGYSITFEPDLQIDIKSPSSHYADGTSNDDGYVNAYDTLHMSVTDQLVTKCLGDFTCSYRFMSGSPAANAALVSFLQGLKNALIDFSGLDVSFTVVLHDGSKVTYLYNAQGKSWTKLPGTAFDAHGNALNPLPPAPHRFIVGPGGPGYDGNNIAHMTQTIVPGDPYCIALEWDGEHLTCILAP